MSTLAPERDVEEIIAGWRQGTTEDGPKSPAGPLFIGGEFAEHEITMTGPYTYGETCDFDTASPPFCCAV